MEITLISAESLKPPTFNLNRRLRTYAVAWFDPRNKVRTTTDHLGGPNPMWHDKKSITTTTQNDILNIEIYTVGLFKDRLIGAAQIRVGDIIIVGSTGGSSLFSFPLRRRRSSSRSGTVNVEAKLKLIINRGFSWVVPSLVLGRKFSTISLSI